jgi:hypothetical protein
MFHALSQLWAMLSSLLSAGERAANSLDLWAAYGEELSKQGVDNARKERAANLRVQSRKTKAKPTAE